MPLHPVVSCRSQPDLAFEDQAIDNFRQVASAFPDSARMQDQFGELLAQSGRYSEALAQFDKALALDPANEDARSDRVMALQHLSAH